MRASDLLRYLILAQLLAFALEPAVSWLHTKRGWRRGSATGLVLVGILLLFVVLGVGMGSVLVGQVDEAAGSCRSGSTTAPRSAACCSRGCRPTGNDGCCGPGTPRSRRREATSTPGPAGAHQRRADVPHPEAARGVPYALALGLFVGVVAAFIPIVGTYIAGAVPVLVALAAVIQAFLSTYSRRYDVLESDLTRVDGPKLPKSRAVQE